MPNPNNKLETTLREIRAVVGDLGPVDMAAIRTILLKFIDDGDGEVARHPHLLAREAQRVARIANEHGWNGVENSKILSNFIESELNELAAYRACAEPMKEEAGRKECPNCGSPVAMTVLECADCHQQWFVHKDDGQ